MFDMSLRCKFEAAELTSFIDVLRESLRVRSRRDFHLWAQGSLQRFLPHDAMIVAWGDFALCLIPFDIVSAGPHIRIEPMRGANLAPTLKRLFDHWNAHSRTPFQISMEDGIFSGDAMPGMGPDGEFRCMKSALVHAIKDERGGGQHDSLYVLMSTTEASITHRRMLAMLLPYIDNALRQVAQEPGGDCDPVVAETGEEAESESSDLDSSALSSRELQIMEWVKNGKTNFEIGMILDISAFTVKNHLQRIFRKLNVVNRAQAVAKLGRIPELHEPA